MFAEVAPKLFELGWRNLLPLTYGKGTTVRWGPLQHKDMTDATFAYFMEKYGDAPRVGFVFGPARDYVAVDIDVENIETAREIANLNSMPMTEFVRVGRSPKALLLYRGKVQSRKMHPIEVFGSSGQVAVFGMHPSTGKPYRWIRKSILDHGPDDLPHVTQEQVDAFLDECMRFVTPKDRSGAPVKWNNSTEEMRLERQIDGANACARQLMRVKPGARRWTLLSVVGWLTMKGYTREEIEEFVDEHFAMDARTGDRKDDWTDPAARVEAMMADAIEKWGGEKDWSL